MSINSVFLVISAVFFLIAKIRTALQCHMTVKKKGGFSFFGSKKKGIPNPPVMPPTGKHQIFLLRHHIEQINETNHFKLARNSFYRNKNPHKNVT